MLYHSALNIKLLEPLAQGASRFEKLLAPPKSTGPIFSNDVSPGKTVVDIIFFWNNDPLKPNVEALVNQIINLRTLVKVNYHYSAVHTDNMEMEDCLTKNLKSWPWPCLWVQYLRQKQRHQNRAMGVGCG